MKNIKSFNEWINEEFATLGNVSGMGNVAAPTSTNIGSGDAWPALGEPSTSLGKTPKKSLRCNKCKQFKKKCTCKND